MLRIELLISSREVNINFDFIRSSSLASLKNAVQVAEDLRLQSQKTIRHFLV